MIENLRVTECVASVFVKPKRILYTQFGVEKIWDMVEVHDSVAVLLFHTERQSFIVVRQFRPPVHLKNGDGYTYELCAGIVDKEKSLIEIAKEEILEECGYDVPVDRIEKVTSFYTAVGFAGAHQTLFYATIDESMHTGIGGGIDEESIEVIEIPVSHAKAFVMDESKAKTPGIMFAIYWFFENQHIPA